MSAVFSDRGNSYAYGMIPDSRAKIITEKSA